jgi:hypothetical protein
MSLYPPNIPRCQHIKVNGTQCGSPALHRRKYCFFHQQWRQEHINLSGRNRRRTILDLPVLEDANSIQISIMQVMRLILSGQIDAKTAGLLLYALQTASINLRRTEFEPSIREECVIHPGDVRDTMLGENLWEREDFEEDDEDAGADADEGEDEDEDDDEGGGSGDDGSGESVSTLLASADPDPGSGASQETNNKEEERNGANGHAHAHAAARQVSARAVAPKPIQSKSAQAKIGPAQVGQAKIGQTKIDQAKVDQAVIGRAKIGQGKIGQAKIGQNKTSLQTKTNLAKAGPAAAHPKLPQPADSVFSRGQFAHPGYRRAVATVLNRTVDDPFFDTFNVRSLNHAQRRKIDALLLAYARAQ